MMRKKTFILLLALLLLAGCGSAETAERAEPAPERPSRTAAPLPTEAPVPETSLSGPEAEAPADDAPEVPAEAPQPTAAPIPLVFTDADTAAMARYMSANRWLADGEWFYGLDFDEELRPALAAFRLRGGRVTGYHYLCRDCVPEYLCRSGDCLYFLHEGSLQRLNLKNRRRETLSPGPYRSLQLYEGSLILTDGEGRCLRADLDGQNAALLLEGPCDCVWAMGEGLLYQDEADGACLRLRAWGGEDRRLTAAASYAPLRVGDTVWYSQRDSLGSVLASVALRDGTVTRYETAALRGAAELIPTADGWTLRVFLAGDGWRQQLLRPGETAGTDCAYSGYRLCDYAGEDCRVDAAYDPDGRLRCFVLVDAAGNELRFLGGKLLD